MEKFSIGEKEYVIDRESLKVKKFANDMKSLSNANFITKITILGGNKFQNEIVKNINYELNQEQFSEGEDFELIINCFPSNDMKYLNEKIYLQWDFFMRNRFRSSLYWLGSGRPCPRCCRNLWEEQGFISKSKVYRIGMQLEKMGNPPSKGIRIPDDLEVLSAIDEARKICIGLKRNNSYILDKINSAEVFDLITGQLRVEKFPVDLLCECW